MFSLVSGMIGLAAAVWIIFLIRRDHLNVRYGMWWILVAAAFVLLGFYPGFFDWLAAQVGIAYGPVLALTLGLTVFAIKLLTLDIARSRSETRIVRLVQRISMLEAQLHEQRQAAAVQGQPEQATPGAKLRDHGGS